MTERAILFDFGGVISRTLFETHDLSEKTLGLPPGTLAWRGPFAPDEDALWSAMQAGGISEREYWHQRTQEVAKLVGANWTQMSDFVKAARGAAPAEVIRPEFLETLSIAKSNGIRLAILSNELDLFYGKEFREKLPFLKNFEVIHDATYTKILKPDPRAYQDCLTEIGLDAEACIFVDDQARNIEGAKKIGLKTVHFDVRSPAEGYAEVLALLGLNQG